MQRQLTLLEAEALRHEAMAKADQDHKSEHQEVADALRWAIRRIGENYEDRRQISLPAIWFRG